MVKIFEKENQGIKDEWEEYQAWKNKREEQRSPESTSSEQTKRFESKRRNRKETTNVKIRVIRLNTEIPKDNQKEIVLTPAPRVLAEKEGRDMPIEVHDEEERPVIEPEGEVVAITGRYASEADEGSGESAVEAEARRKVGHFEFLHEHLASIRLPRNKDINFPEKFRTMRRTSTSSSSKKSEKKEFRFTTTKPKRRKG